MWRRSKSRWPQQHHVSIPAFLRVNSEYRAFVKRFYHPCFQHYTRNASLIYFNFAEDTILVPFFDSLKTFLGEGIKFVPDAEYLRLIQNVAIMTGVRTLRQHTQWQLFHSLKRIEICRFFKTISSYNYVGEFETAWTKEFQQDKRGRKQGIQNEEVLMKVREQDRFEEIFNCLADWKGK